MNDAVLACDPAEEVFENAQAITLSAPAQQSAVGFLAAPEPMLITLEDWAGNLAGPV